MNKISLINKKYFAAGLAMLFLSVLLTVIITRNLKKDGNETGFALNDSLKALAISDLKDIAYADYSKYYDVLKDKGEWIKVDPEEYIKNYGKENKSVAGRITDFIIRKLGADFAFADDFYMNTFFVWKPSPEFSLGIAAGEPAPAVFVPYTYGRWVYTDYGWYFRAPTYEAEIVHHYGRWIFVPAAGWIWIPGRQWAPAWVHWEYDDDYIAWSPLVPNIYYVSNYVYVPPVYTNINFVAVEKRYFVYPDLYKHIYYGADRNDFIKERLKIKGDKYFYNYSVKNSGPRPNMYGKDFGKWNLKTREVDFVNSGPDNRRMFRENTAFGREKSMQDNIGKERKFANEKPGVNMKRERNNTAYNEQKGFKIKSRDNKENSDFTAKKNGNRNKQQKRGKEQNDFVYKGSDRLSGNNYGYNADKNVKGNNKTGKQNRETGQKYGKEKDVVNYGKSYRVNESPNMGKNHGRNK